MRPVAILILVACTTMAQSINEYKVVRVVGLVESPVLNRALRTGDVINGKDHLKFGSNEAYLIVTSPKTGRKKISGVPDNSPREFLQLLESFIKPELKSTASRSISLQYLESLQNSMAYDTLLVLGDGFVPVDTSKLSLGPPAAIKAWHTRNGKVVYQKISTRMGFSLSPSIIFESPLPDRLPRVVIEYFQNENDDPVFEPGLLLAAFVPLTVDEKRLADELRVILAIAAGKEQQMTEINNYLISEYAPAQKTNLAAWISANNLLK